MGMLDKMQMQVDIDKAMGLQPGQLRIQMTKECDEVRNLVLSMWHAGYELVEIYNATGITQNQSKRIINRNTNTHLA